MAGGASGAMSGGILGLVLVLLAQQFGYVDFTSLEQTLILVILVIFVFAVVFGLLGRVMKGSAIRRAKAGATTASATEPPPAPEAEATPPPSEPDTPPPA